MSSRRFEAAALIISQRRSLQKAPSFIQMTNRYLQKNCDAWNIVWRAIAHHQISYADPFDPICMLWDLKSEIIWKVHHDALDITTWNDLCHFKPRSVSGRDVEEFPGVCGITICILVHSFTGRIYHSLWAGVLFYFIAVSQGSGDCISASSVLFSYILKISCIYTYISELDRSRWFLASALRILFSISRVYNYIAMQV